MEVAFKECTCSHCGLRKEGGSVNHVLRVGWLVFWQGTERGNCRFSFFSPKSDLLGLISCDATSLFQNAARFHFPPQGL